LLHDRQRERDFTRFVKEVEPRLSCAFYAAYGPEVGNEVTADALAYAWENWDKVTRMDNPAGYLYRVGQSKARRYHRPPLLFPRTRPENHAPEFEPALPAALEELTESQRQAVILVYALEWTEEEAARVLGKSRSTLRTHLERGLAHLRQSLEVAADG
jgi:RNA polymerase sigma factor (sigma-70 family)